MGHDLANALEQEPELAMLVTQPPIAFHRIFVDMTGSVTAALLLSVYMEVSDYAANAEGWVSLSMQELQQRSGLSLKEQSTARKALCQHKLIEERKQGFPATLEIRINYQKLSSSLLQLARQRRPEPVRASHGSTPELAH